MKSKNFIPAMMLSTVFACSSRLWYMKAARSVSVSMYTLCLSRSLSLSLTTSGRDRDLRVCTLSVCLSVCLSLCLHVCVWLYVWVGPLSVSVKHETYTHAFPCIMPESVSVGALIAFISHAHTGDVGIKREGKVASVLNLLASLVQKYKH